MQQNTTGVKVQIEGKKGMIRLLQKVADKVVIPDADAIRGNIALLSEIDGVRIRWESSNPGCISDRYIDKKAPGVVTRGETDCQVTLKAILEYQGETLEKEISVTVLAAPEMLRDEDYKGYLFGHFIGEDNEMGEQIYFAVSEDGLHFQDISPSKPLLISTVGEKGVRDPYLYRSPEGDRYFLIATDLSIYHRGGWFLNEQGYYDASTTGSSNLVLWESNDLVHWGEPRLLPVAPKNAGMAWAPEMIYHQETGEYVVFFASSIMNPDTKYKAKPNAIYYTATRDFIHFGETKLFIDCQTDKAEDGKPREIIDTTVLKVGDTYYSASKDGDNAEKNGGIRIMKTKNLLDYTSWEKVLDLDELGLDTSATAGRPLDNGLLEGPELFRFNKKDWADKNVPEYGLIADQYAIGAGYLPLTTTNLEDKDNSNGSWRILPAGEYSFDKLKKRHGTIMPITEQEMQRLTEFAKNA